MKATELDTDEVLMQKYQLGDELAFNLLYERYADRIFSFLIYKTRDCELANEIFQTTFLKLHTYRSRYDSIYPFIPWIFTICRNELISAYRLKKIIPENFMDDISDFAIEENSIGDFDISETISTLPNAQKEAILLRYQDEASFEEIALKLETTGVNARKIVSRALKHIRRFYERSN